MVGLYRHRSCWSGTRRMHAGRACSCGHCDRSCTYRDGPRPGTAPGTAPGTDTISRCAEGMHGVLSMLLTSEAHLLPRLIAILSQRWDALIVRLATQYRRSLSTSSPRSATLTGEPQCGILLG